MEATEPLSLSFRSALREASDNAPSVGPSPASAEQLVVQSSLASHPVDVRSRVEGLTPLTATVFQGCTFAAYLGLHSRVSCETVGEGSTCAQSSSARFGLSAVACNSTAAAPDRGATSGTANPPSGAA